eukprot:TRINITY_DN11058_c0_g1_i2.p1 TRINITY_DN11058_c0_g1~~TRINITY_DN11058_c0_g1_i2.p1  ORF type:complete len:308 (+),score=16.52 TRINITY_DN11058_c0_g1_i2:75-926(+)
MPAKKRAVSVDSDKESAPPPSAQPDTGIPVDVQNADDATSRFVVSLAARVESTHVLIEQILDKFNAIPPASLTAAPVNDTTEQEVERPVPEDPSEEVYFDQLNINARAVVDWAPHVHVPSRVTAILNSIRNHYGLHHVSLNSTALVEQEKARYWEFLVTSRVERVWILEQLPLLQLFLNRLVGLNFFPPSGEAPRARLDEAKACADAYAKAVDGRPWQEMDRRFFQDVDDKVNKARSLVRSKTNNASALSTPVSSAPAPTPTKRQRRPSAWNGKRTKAETSKN